MSDSGKSACCLSDGGKSLGLLMARVPLGAFFSLRGFKKVHDGVYLFVAEHTGHLPGYVPAKLGHYYLTALPWVEMVVGAMLVFGFLTRAAGFVASALLVSFMLAVTGAFSWQLPVVDTNVIFLGVTLLTLFAGAGKLSVDGALWGKRCEDER